MQQFLAYPRIYVFFFCSHGPKENAALSACLEAAPPAAPSSPSTNARAARLAKFKREQRIVEYLNRGVSVAEIAAQVGVGEKRMRAVIREILARRMPHPPEEFVAIQLSRLNEALLVAYSAMSPTNLKAVDQVVKIVRELDRYGGAFAAEWARPEASRAEPGERSPASARPCSAARSVGCGHRPPLQAPGAAIARKIRRNILKRLNPRPGSAPLRRAPPGSEPGVGDAVDDRVDKPVGTGDRPRNPANILKGYPPGGLALVAALAERGDAVDDRVYRRAGAGDRSENPAQHLEKVNSAPGVSTLVAALAERGYKGRRPRLQSSRPGLDSRSHPEPVKERTRSPGPALLLEHAAGRDGWRRSTAWRWRLSVHRPGGTRPPGKPRASP